MNIPQVNATVTKRNCEQAERICELAGWDYIPNRAAACAIEKCADGCCGKEHAAIDLPNGSFTLCQVVGMLRKEKAKWEHTHGWTFQTVVGGFWQWVMLGGKDDPLDLTAAMDALIKVLEAKK